MADRLHEPRAIEDKIRILSAEIQALKQKTVSSPTYGHPRTASPGSSDPTAWTAVEATQKETEIRHLVDMLMSAQDEIRRTLTKMDDREATAIEARFVLGLTIDEVAGVLGVSRRHAMRVLRSAAERFERTAE